MPKASKNDPTKNGGSSGKESQNGDVEASEPVEAKVDADKVISFQTGTPGGIVDPTAPSDQQEEKPIEKKRRGRAPTEGQALKRVLIFLSESDVVALKAEVGDRGVSTKIREIIKKYLTKRG